jgi:HEAT repeat protein
MLARRILLLASLTLPAVGCGERPFADWGLVDPWTRTSWKEDERFGPTFHTKRQELRNRRHAVKSLSPEEQERAAIELAERLREEEHPVLRGEIIRALGPLRSEMAAETLRAAVNDTDPDVRVIACETWGRRGGDDARQVLVGVLGSDTDADVRIAATRELGRFKSDPQAMQALKVALDENNPALQFRAVESLKNMSGKDYGSDLIAWREYIDGGNPPEPPAASIADRLKNWY